MSGPKCGHVEIRNRTRLEHERRQREEAEATELAQLEAKAMREQREDQRLAELREKETRRRERDARRAAERARLAEQQRVHEEAVYQRARAGLEGALSRRADLLSRFDGLQLPQAPELVEAARADTQSAQAATAQLLRTAHGYQEAVDRALIDWHRNHEAATSREKAGALAARIRTRAVRTAEDVISALDVDQPAMQAALRDANLALRSRRARELVARCGDGMPWKGTLELSEGSLAALDDILTAPSEPVAQSAMFLLQTSLTADAGQAAQVHQATEAKRAADQLAQEHAAKERDRELVASTIRDTLQDMGYAVGEIEETAFVKNGTLYFSRSGWTDHAVQVQLDEQLGIRVEPMRIANDGVLLGPADIATQRAADATFDLQWCSSGGPGGLGELKQNLAERGLGMPLQAERTASGAAMRRVADTKAGNAQRKARGQVDNGEAPKERKLPGPP